MVLPMRRTRLNSGYSFNTDQRRTKAGTIAASKHFMERSLGSFINGWTPDQISPALWLDASVFSSITIATGVSEWRDISGNNRHATQATTSLQPAYQATGLNGLPTINWGDFGLLSAGKVLHTPSFSIGTSNIAATFVVAFFNI